ncbi:MAG: cation:proton antiporter [Rickettsiales bacterium]|nr:MAG: cation:proton antiporter [Rickettsiales bacterium]
MHNLIYFFAVIILTSGLFIMLTSDNYIRKIIGLAIFQSSVLIFYIALGKSAQGIVPIDICEKTSSCLHVFSSPLPHVLMLTAIVVGFATMAVGLALIMQIHTEYGTILESKVTQHEEDI